MVMGLYVHQRERFLKKDYQHAGRHMEIGKLVLAEAALFAKHEGWVFKTYKKVSIFNRIFSTYQILGDIDRLGSLSPLQWFWAWSINLF